LAIVKKAIIVIIVGLHFVILCHVTRVRVASWQTLLLCNDAMEKKLEIASNQLGRL